MTPLLAPDFLYVILYAANFKMFPEKRNDCLRRVGSPVFPDVIFILHTSP